MRGAAVFGLMCWACLPSDVHAFELPRAATLAFEQTVEAGRYAVPLGPIAQGGLPLSAQDGQITRRVWQVPQSGLTTLRIFQDIRDQFIEDGQEVLFECSARACGGFDFRYAIEVLEAPAMFVDLGDFHFASFADPANDARQTLLISKGGTTGYVQLIEVRAPGTAPQIPVAGTAPIAPGLLASEMDLAEKLRAAGATILDDLEFATGADALTDERFNSVVQLAAFLTTQPDAQVVLVGHTDATGSLENNIALSKRRAEAVRARLIDRYGVRPAQVTADGVGFLAPRTGNSDEAGRKINRRVEVVLLSPP